MKHMTRIFVGLIVSAAISLGAASAAQADINLQPANPAIFGETLAWIDRNHPDLTKQPGWDSSQNFKRAIGAGIYIASKDRYKVSCTPPARCPNRTAVMRAAKQAENNGSPVSLRIANQFDNDLLFQTVYTRNVYREALFRALRDKTCPIVSVFESLKFFAAPGLANPVSMSANLASNLIICYFRGQLPL